MERSVSLKVFGPALYREAVELRLAACPGFVQAEQPEVVMLLGDLWMAELEKLRCVITQDQAGIVLVAHQRTDLLPAVQLGIEVFLDEDGGETELHQALRAAAARSGYCSPGLMPGLLRRLRPGCAEVRTSPRPVDRLAALSEREREVALCVGRGWKNERVASELHLSLATVKFHLSNIYTKLGIECRAELAAYLSQPANGAEAAPH